MKNIFLFGILLLLSATATAQEPAPSPSPATGETATTISGPGITNLPLPDPDAALKLLNFPRQNGYIPPDAKTRRERFIKSTVGPYALGKLVATAGIGTWRKSPEEWGTKWEGFGRRVASNFAKNAIKQTVKFGLDEALRVDSHFYKSKSKSVGTRFRNALISPVTARDRQGNRVFGVPNLVATYTSSIIAYETWYPPRYSWKNGVRTGTISLGFNAAFNLFKEFVWRK